MLYLMLKQSKPFDKIMEIWNTLNISVIYNQFSVVGSIEGTFSEKLDRFMYHNIIGHGHFKYKILDN